MDVQEILFAKKLAGGGGGGTTEVINGTADVPFPDMTDVEFNQLIRDMVNRNAAAVMIINATSMGLGNLSSGLIGIIDDNDTSYILMAQVADPEPDNQIQLVWVGPNGLIGAKARIGGNLVDMRSSAANFPTTTTIYRI